MSGAVPPGGEFAIGNDEQYRPVGAVGDQRIRVSGPEGTGLLACHASRPLGDGCRGPVVVVVHGALRDSDRYLASALDAARLAGSDALIVAPQFLADVDRADLGRADGALCWGVEGWKGGYPALGPAPLSSFTAMDSLLGQLALLAEPGPDPAGPGPDPAGPGPDPAEPKPDPAEPRPDPAVVVFGNSAGGQFVNRYAAVGRGPDLLAARGLRVRFVISNPSTYLYFDRERPVAVPDATRVNNWRYGFDGAPGYVDADPGGPGGPRRSLERYLGRDVTLVLGALDADGASLLLEVSPAAMAQGANRFDRGLHYDQHVRGLARAAGLPARHRLIELAGIGHTAGDVLAAPQIGEIVFGRP